MLSASIFGSLICLLTLVKPSPVGNPNDDAKHQQPALRKRNILVPDYLIPTKAIDPELVAGTPAIVLIDLVPTAAVDLAKPAALTMPNLVPTSHVDIATDTLGTQIVSPLFVPTAVAKIGTTSGCVVSISSYSYVTHCNFTSTPTPISTGIANCCGGEGSLHPCNDAGTIPTGPATWTCTFGSTTCAGVTTATTR